MTTATLHHSTGKTEFAKTQPGVMQKIAGFFTAARSAKADRETLQFLRGFDDKTLMDFGYSYSAVRELRAGRLAPLSY